MIQTVVDAQRSSETVSLHIAGQSEGLIALLVTAVGCSNPDCLKTTVDALIAPAVHSQNSWRVHIPTGKNAVFKQRLLPRGTAQPQPDYIPQALRDDYYEACLIRDLSPKASATLIRRCLQGMIRDFAGISKDTLNKEIIALGKAVEDGTADRAITPETVEAIDHVRGVGNIGAHMEKDINLIVDVDPGEAQALIDLVELLFEEWYVAREARRSKLARIAGIAEQKKAARRALPAPQPEAAELETGEMRGTNHQQVNALLHIATQERKSSDGLP